jgi:hypothetical protein
MRTVRRGTFETNSSSTHSITMCMESDYEKWKNGEMYWHRWNDELVSKEEVEKEMAKLREEFIADNPDFDENNEEWKEELDQYINEDKMYYTYEEFNDYDYIEYETFVDTFETPQGEKVVSFGYYGSDY